jgi:hypothetical protein
MKYLINIAVLAAMVVGSASLATAESKKAAAPGQDRACLVTTSKAGSFNDTDVANAKWLPRKAAEQQASKDPSTMRVFDYGNDPLVQNKTYASAEDLCNRHFN